MKKVPEETPLAYLVSDVARLMRRDFDQRVRTLKLTQAQWRAIVQLYRDEGMNQSTLAERLEVTAMTLARLVDRLEAAGWVRRRPDADDRRATRLYLTPKARPVIAKMREHAQAARAGMLRGIPLRDQAKLRRYLETMKENLSKTLTSAGAVNDRSGADRSAGRRR